MILYNRYYSPITEGINGFFINHNHKNYIRIYESYYNRVRKFEHVLLSYKKNQSKLLKKNILDKDITIKKDDKYIREWENIMDNMKQQKKNINEELKKIIWLSGVLFKINNSEKDTKKNGIYKKHNNSLCKAIFNKTNKKWDISINYDRIKL